MNMVLANSKGSRQKRGVGTDSFVALNLPRDWVRTVNRAETGAEVDALRQCVIRGLPFGGPAWTARTVGRLGLENTLRPRGRPRKLARTKTLE